MANLYIWVDDRNRERVSRTVGELARRHPQLRDFLTGGDRIEGMLNLLFPHGLPMEYYAANLSIENRPDDNLSLALRPVINPEQPWPFPRGCSLAVRGFWPTRVPSPVFMVQDLFEVADAPGHSYERSLSVVVYQDNPQLPRIQRNNNALTRELAFELPPISITTREKLVDWTEFLKWKRKLVSEKTRGLRFIQREWQEDRIVFRVIGESEQSLREVHRSLSRQDVMAFDLNVSVDPWTFRISDREGAKRAPRGFELGQPEAMAKIAPHKDKIKDCEWNEPHLAEVVVALSEDDQNQLTVAEDLANIRQMILSRIPEQGFLSVSAAGDLALIRRHEMAIKRLQDQGGYAPYLSSYLFDARQAKKPSAKESITHWFRDDLNPFQKDAVEKILTAPDLCLIQGPPGTGKTTVIAEAIMQLARRGERVLLASQAHTAVDNALERLGKHPDLRVIRLARDLDKVSGDGKSFVQQAALSRYYSSLAEHASDRFLKPWRETADRMSQLQSWLNRAEYVRRDIVEAQRGVDLYEQGRVRAKLERDLAWQRLQEQAQKHEDAKRKRNRLSTLREFLVTGEEDVADGCPLPEPLSSELAFSLFGLTAARTKLPVSKADWDAVPQQRPQMLAGLVRCWRKLRTREPELERDVARLYAAGPRSLQSPDVAIRIAELEAEEKALAERVDDDDSLVSAWRAKRQEIKQLRNSSAGGLSADLYSDLFVDADRWCAAIDNAEQVGAELADRLAALRTSNAAIDQALERLIAEVHRLIDLCEVPEIDESEWRQREQELEQHIRTEPRVNQSLTSSLARASELFLAQAAESSANDKQVDVAAMLSQEILVRQGEARTLEEQIQNQKDEQYVWGQLLQDWVNDLRRPASAQSDWEHFKEVYVPQCNVVAITCNEREQTLEDSGQVSFDVAIIDEVSKATPLEMLLPLMRARRSILVGDHRQLPPLFQEGADAQTFSDVVDEAEQDEQESRTALTRLNLLRFEKMVTASLFKSHFEAADDAIRARLEVQFRMHPQIMTMVNHFYERRLTCGLAFPNFDRNHGLVLVDADGKTIIKPALDGEGNRIPKNISLPSSEIPREEKEKVAHEGDHVLWVDTSRNLEGQIHKEDMDAAGKPARSNRLEAQLIAHTLLQLDKQSALLGYSPQKRRQVGVVSFYARQCRLIREAIRAVKPSGRFECLDVEVNTVIRYQGKEKPIILVSLVRNDGIDTRSQGMARRRSSRANVARYEFINVAFSRAQELLIVFGARSMYESYEVTLPHMDREGSTTRTVYKDILDQLDRDARLIPASRLMRNDNPGQRKFTPRPSNGNRGNQR
ncbi:AAA domain-containing protein [Pelomonas sp. UHG3]|uniref:AAA domain-containing protein n=1 Tax=Roseateles hydrophilus TaxID=2975054 RepID=A0ACC6CEI5_9BURK|nr:AAA domain-containing protein [Pelomonas sp. UHG3]MCY4746833.1 AAA domain-containing protein [Pelomonas sp. UHG3]